MDKDEIEGEDKKSTGGGDLRKARGLGEGNLGIQKRGFPS
jgi:hypothetical protein